MSDKINVRSPYYIQLTDEDATYTLANATIEIQAITGTATGLATAPVLYTLTKDALGDNVTFEISELVRDYITTEFDGTYANEPLWVNVSATGKDASNNAVQIALNGGTASPSPSWLGLAFDGYNLFEEGINNLSDQIVFLTDRTDTDSEITIYRPSDGAIRIPVNTDQLDLYSDGAVYDTYLDGVLVSDDVDISTSTNTDSKIKYINVGSTFNKVELFRYQSGQTIITKIFTVLIENLNCTKHESVKVTFYNRWGALQDLYFIGKTTQSINTTGEQYKANVIDFSTLTYNVAKHQYNQYDKQGKRTIQLSTGYVNEDYNAWIEELMLSEKVWITLDGTLYPATPKTSSQTFKTRLNDSLVAYTVDFEYAFDQIQNIR